MRFDAWRRRRRCTPAGADKHMLKYMLGSEYPSTLEKARASAFVELQTSPTSRPARPEAEAFVFACVCARHVCRRVCVGVARFARV